MTQRWCEKKVAVLMGGETREREISLKTGRAVSAALARSGYDVVEIDAGKKLVSDLAEHRVEVAFVALHGKFGEDGCVQGLLEWLRIPYTGSGVLASAIAMDKVVCKEIAKGLQMTLAEDAIFTASTDDPHAFAQKLALPFPVIVKPSREGSTINATIVREQSALPAALALAAASDDAVIVERYIDGKEVTVGLLDGKALPVLEIAPKSGFYDYAAKYTKGMTEYIVPARVSDGCALKLCRDAERIFGAIRASGVARADFIVAADERSFFLEINTIPGMTELSLVPKAAAHVGIGFDELCERILHGACLKV